MKMFIQGIFILELYYRETYNTGINQKFNEKKMGEYRDY